jgi:hypothetical protein
MGAIHRPVRHIGVIKAAHNVWVSQQPTAPMGGMPEPVTGGATPVVPGRPGRPEALGQQLLALCFLARP